MGTYILLLLFLIPIAITVLSSIVIYKLHLFFRKEKQNKCNHHFRYIPIEISEMYELECTKCHKLIKR